jgi:molybdate transport system substrate-binding protein
MKTSLSRVVGATLALLIGAGVSAADLTVSAASSLTNVFHALGPLFETANPGTRVLFNFGASGALLQQIAKGAPADVFASADQETMDQAQAQNLIQSASRRNFALNALVIIVPATGGLMPKALGDLAQARYKRIAIGLPASVPVGRYTKLVLEQAGLWPAIEPRMIGAQSVRQALDYTARGEVDAGFVYATDAALMPNRVKVALTVPTPLPVLYPIAPIRSSGHPDEAQKFVAFIQSAPAQTVLAKYGFGTP